MDNSKKKIVLSIVIAIVIIVLVCIGIACSRPTEVTNITEKHSNGSVFIIDDRSVAKEDATQAIEDKLNNRSVYFAGYVDAKITKTSTVALENLPENEDFFLKYTITDSVTNDVVFETDLIASGQCVVWTPGESLEEGTHELQFLASPYYQDENGIFVPLTAGSSTVKYTISN